MAAPKPARVTRPTNVFSKPTAACTATGHFDYEAFYMSELDKKHKDKSYRYFNNINRLAKHFPQAHLDDPSNLVTAWCSNDYVSISARCSWWSVLTRHSWVWDAIRRS